MSSAICQNFVQNAWKKELCSNCFKSKDEHAEPPKPKPITILPNDNLESIIRNTAKVRPKRSVCFTTQLTEVIGVGGEDWGEEPDSNNDDEESSSEEDFVAESEEEEADKELKRITKENTDFNTTGLKEEVVAKKTPSLLLGKPIVDAAGRKQTLMVSVTPFGEDAPPGPKRFIKSLSHIPISKGSNKESITDTKNGVVLTSYTKNQVEEEKSLLDEITETLQNSKNPIQIMARKKTQKDIVLECNKENIHHKEDKPRLQLERKGLSRTPALKRDLDKPMVQTSTARIELNTNKLKPKEELPSIKNPELEKVLGLPPIPKPSQNPFSREQAGEPDGRADPDVTEPPALPLTPPPPLLEGQTSFLHNVPIYEKPKVPSKPATMVIRKPIPINQPEVKNQVLTTFTGELKAGDKTPLSKQDSNSSDASKVNKRRAPRPPEEVYLRHPPPVMREKEKRERASSSSPGPEPAPRKSLSLSTDSLSSCEEKRKSKGRFSLKKFLRMGSSKEGRLFPETVRVEEVDGPPMPKPRLVIVHPLELNGARVEVVKSHEVEKPPPPPRNVDECSLSYKPTHPPKSVDIINRQKQYSTTCSGQKTAPPETVYANIGEVRSAMVPNKPQRTASMREREAQQQKKGIYEEENVYDYINSERSSSPGSDSTPSKDSPTSKAGGRLSKRSESSIDVSGEYFKYSQIPRSLSLTYCGSETESEIYSPYSFYGSESEVTEDDHDWIQNGRTHKLRSRKGRSIVHKNLEDNYGAVIVANHEALAQVLENIQQTNHIQPALRGLKSSPNLTWSEFSVLKSTQPLVVGHRTFHQALWNTHHVTLVINTGAVPSSTLSLGTCSLSPITEFSDLVPIKYLHNEDADRYVQATVAVLPWLQVTTIQSYSESLKAKAPVEETWKDATFIMLQLVNALKTLQAQGIEELSLTLNSFVLCKEMDKDSHQRLCVLQGLGEETRLKDNTEQFGTLCMCASRALTLLQPTAKITPLLQSLLNNERAVTLTQVKSILEFCLWGPSDVALGTTIRERELALQRWLDLQRATVLHGLVCARVQLTVYEECHLFFLVRSNSRMMCDASLLLESSNMKHVLTANGN